MARRPENYQLFVELLGTEGAEKLCTYFSGEYVYVPKMETIKTIDRIERIKAEVTPYNIKELSKRYGLTTNRIRQIAKDQT